MEEKSKHIRQEKDPRAEVKKKSRIAAILGILFWFLLLGYPLLSYTFPLPEKMGIVMSFGELEGGGDQLSELASSNSETKNTPENNSSAPQKKESQEASKEETTARSVESKTKQETEESTQIKTTVKKEKQKRKVTIPKKQADTENTEALKKAEQEAAQKAKREADERNRKAEEEAKKKEFGNFFSGEGENEEAKKQGDPESQPNTKNLDVLTTGTANIGDGLSDRGILYEPEINDNSQRTGRIVVRICINSRGTVTEAKYTQKGSTSTDLYLIKVAEDAANKYKFSGSGLEKQCGVISIDFKLK